MVRRDGEVFTAPFNRMAELQRDFDDWFGGMWPESRQAVRVWAPPMDVQETANELRCVLEVPGVDPSQIELTVEQNVLTISGERHQDRSAEEGTYHLSERRFGRFVRTLRLPSRVDADRVQARYDHGLLYVLLPKTEEARARRIEIQTAGADRQITEAAQS